MSKKTQLKTLIKLLSEVDDLGLNVILAKLLKRDKSGNIKDAFVLWLTQQPKALLEQTLYEAQNWDLTLCNIPKLTFTQAEVTEKIDSLMRRFQ